MAKAELGKKEEKKGDKLGAKEIKPCFADCIFLYGDQCNTILKSMVVSSPTASVLVECLIFSENGSKILFQQQKEQNEATQN